MRISARNSIAVFCALLLVFGVAVPLALMIAANAASLGYEGAAELRMRGAGGSERKLMREYNDDWRAVDGSELQHSVRELEDIQASVRNELRTLEQYRSKTTHDIDYHKDILSSLKKELSAVKQELQETRSNLARVSHEAKKDGRALSPAVVNPAPIVVIRSSEDSQFDVPVAVGGEDGEGGEGVRGVEGERCTFETCFRFSKCPILKPFKVYVYNAHFSELFPLRYPQMVTSLTSNLAQTKSLTDDPSQACVFVVIVGPLRQPLSSVIVQRKLQSLSHWNGKGENHVLIDISLAGLDTVSRVLSGVETSRAIIAQSFFQTRDVSYRRGYDIALPTVVAVETPRQPWKGLPPHLPVLRETLLHFNMRYIGRYPDSAHFGPIQLEKFRDTIQAQTSDKFAISTNCFEKERQILDDIRTDHVQDSETDSRFLGDDWVSCDLNNGTCFRSTFALVLGNHDNRATPSSHVSLINALRCGSIPVIVGGASLPFMEIIDWERAAIFLPAARFGELHYVLRNIEENAILEYRRQGRFLWETYFCSAELVLATIVALVRSRSLHPPPSLDDVTAKTLIRLHHERNIENRRLGDGNSTLLCASSSGFWNNPPGPFYFSRLTPFKPGPVSGMQYDHLTSRDVLNLPLHILQAGGITGPYFEDLLLGNDPPEEFTVVILTYQRNQVLLEALERLKGTRFLAKVVVIWNNEEVPDSDMTWNVDFPVEVVANGRNSLNNRFLPLSSIETEAVLSIDDDVHLRQDEIQFAFRVWREARDRIVGFPGRFHARDIRHSSWLYNSNYTCELSMVLTGAAFIHKYYLHLYTHWMPVAVRDMVDRYMNCEDIAMNFLVSHITRKAPLKVTSRWTFRCPGCPETLSTSEEHFNERHVCINFFSEVFGYTPLLYTQFRVDSVLFKTRISSNLEKCYQFI